MFPVKVLGTELLVVALMVEVALPAVVDGVVLPVIVHIVGCVSELGTL